MLAGKCDNPTIQDQVALLFSGVGGAENGLPGHNAAGGDARLCNL